MATSTITLQSVVNVASTHVDLLPLAGVGGYANEPALSLCNDALQELMSAPYDWKFNRTEMPMLVTMANKQDYLFAGATAFTLGGTSAGAAIGLASNNAVSESGTTVTVNTLEAHRFSVGDTVYMTGNGVAAYNSTFTDDGTKSQWAGGWTITAVPSSTSFQFTHAQSGLATSGAPGITDFGWLTSGTLVEMNNTSSPQNVKIIEGVKDIQPSGRVTPMPEKVCVLHDLGTGVIKIRFQYVPGSTIWGVNLVYQAKPPLKVALTDTWGPFPDELSFVYRQAFIARAYRYLNSPRADAEYQKLQLAIQKALGAADRETSDVHLYPETPIVDAGYGSWWE